LLFANSGDCRRVIGCAEYCGAGDDRVGASGDRESRGLTIFSAVDFDYLIESALLTEPMQPAYLGSISGRNFCPPNRPKPKRAIMRDPKSPPSRRDSNKTASGNPGRFSRS